MARAASLSQLVVDRSNPEEDEDDSSSAVTQTWDLTLVRPAPPLLHESPSTPKRKSSKKVSTTSSSKKKEFASPESIKGIKKISSSRAKRNLPMRRLPRDIEMDHESSLSDSDCDTSEMYDVVSPLVSLRCGSTPKTKKMSLLMSSPTSTLRFDHHVGVPPLGVVEKDDVDVDVNMDAVKRIAISELEKGYALAQKENDLISERIHLTQLYLLRTQKM